MTMRRMPGWRKLWTVVVACVLAAVMSPYPARGQLSAPLPHMTVLPQVTSMQPGSMTQGQNVDLRLHGTHLRDGLGVDFGAGITATSTHATDPRAQYSTTHVTVAANAAVGRRQLVLVLPGGVRKPQHAYLSVQAGRATVQVHGAGVTLHATPEVTAVQPDVLEGGHDYTLKLSVRGLDAHATFDFGSGIQTQSKPVAINDSTLGLKVHVDASAPEGRRVVTFTLPAVQNAVAAIAPVTGKGPASVTVKQASHPVSVQSTTTQSASAPPATTQHAAAPSAAAPTAVLATVHPLRVRAGGQAQLVFTGQGLGPGLRVDYGAGFHLQPLHDLGGGRYSALVAIDANATPGQHMPRATQQGRPVRVEPTTALLVLPSGAPPPARQAVATTAPHEIAPMLRVENLFPARVDAGKSYTLLVGGTGFTSHMQLDLGRGMQVESIEVVDDRHARLHVQVESGVVPGMRFARARPDARRAWQPQPARLLIEQIVPVVALPRPKWQAPDFKHMTIEGHIDLQLPQWYSGLASQPAPKDPITGKPMGEAQIVKVGIDVPAFKDDLLFTWHERNPGMAEWYEVRFYKDKKLVATRKVDKQHVASLNKDVLPTFLIPDPALVAGLSKAAPAGGAQWKRDPKTGKWSVSGVPQSMASNAQFVGSGGSGLPQSDLTWEVVGFRKYYTSGVEAKVAERTAKPEMLAANDGTGLAQAAHAAMSGKTDLGHMVAREVERSDRWPLDTTRGPTGMDCGSQAASALDVLPIDNAASTDGGHSKDIIPAVHTGERWQLTGAFNLGRSPWASDPQMAQWPYVQGAGQGKKYVATTWHFDNVFVDWGDGTVVPLGLTQQGDAGHYHGNTTVDLGNALGDKRQFEHAYAEVGNYTVRVYQLSEGDLQDQSAAGVSVAANPGGSLYAAALQLGGSGKPDAGQGNGAPPGFKHAGAVADRAYMVMCKQVHIEPRHDDATDGPLHLIAAKLRGFPEDPGDDTPPAGVKVAPAPDNSPFKLAHPASNGASGTGHAQEMSATGAGMTLDRKAVAKALFADQNGVPAFSACDVALTGGGYLYYYGSGQVRLKWYMDGQQIGSSVQSLGPSWPRPDKQLASKDPGDPLIRASDLLLSAPIPLKPLGDHTLNFDAEVVYDASGLAHLGGLMGRALGSGGRRADAELAGQLSAGMQGAPAIGVLPPSGVPVHGGDPVAWLNAPLQRVAEARADPVLLAYAGAGQVRQTIGGTPNVSLNGVVRSAGAASRQAPKKPPEWAGSNQLGYRVAGVREDMACIFHFPVKDGGSFLVGSLQNAAKGTSNVTHEGNHWNGAGRLHLRLPSADGTGTVDYPVDITFHDWQLQPDGTTVASGSFDVDSLAGSLLFMPATSVQLTRVTGTAGDSVKLGLVATLANPDIHMPGSSSGPPPMHVTSEISPDGDFYAAVQGMPDLDVYDSEFILHDLKAVLDFSASQGQACGSGAGWRGVAFTSAALDAYTFQIGKKQTATANGWGIDGAGFCGTQKFASYDAKVQRGSIHWDGIDASASKGAFTASYKGLRAHVPWLDVDLTADSATALHSGKGATGGGKITLNLKGDAPRRDFGAVSMDADGLALETLQGVGMVASAQGTHFAFRADGQVFDKDVAVPGLFFGMDGKAYFEEGGGSAHVDLSGTKGRLSQGVIDLKGVDVTATPTTSERLQFNFTGSLRISDALPAADAPVSYRVDEVQPKTYVGSGPVTGSFVIHKPFPDANPTTDSVIRPDYVGSNNGAVASSESPTPVLDFLVPRAQAEAQHMRYCGDVDLGMFGGPPVKGGFALGYQGTDDFWAARADVSLGTSGTPLVPPYMTLYTVGGGLGYNITIDSFENHSSCDVKANIDHTPVFSAHLVVGDPTHFIYGLDGHFTVKTGGPEAGARMQYQAWILKKDWSDKGDLWGRFQYVGGNFDGNLNGHYGFLDDKVYIEATNDAIAMHFGSGKWFVHAGTRDNPVKGHVLIINAGAWVGVGGDGLYAGAKADLDEGAGDCGSICARVTSHALIEAKITPAPHISANGHMDVHAKGCAFDICLGAGVGAGVHLAALPPELAFSFNLGGCPPGHLDVGLRILPSPKPSIGGGLCLW